MSIYVVSDTHIEVETKRVHTAKNGDRYCLLPNEELWIIDNFKNLIDKYTNVKLFEINVDTVTFESCETKYCLNI